LLADLGASRYQLTDAGRGFSFNANGPLDMRMDRSQGPTASELVNTMSEQALADLIYNLGEERRSRRIARAIVRARPLHSTEDLVRAVERAVPRTGRLHPATQTFMALRLAVNGEQEELDRLLELIPQMVSTRARGGHHLHVARRPQSEAQFSSARPRTASAHPYPARLEAAGRRSL